MAVAHDFASESHTGTVGSVSEASFTWSHNPVGAPKGILVLTFVMNQTGDFATAVTYDGVNVPAVTGGRATDTANEPGDCKAWFLGTSVPTTDPANIVVTRTNNTAVMWAVGISVTALTDTEIYLPGIVLLNENQAAAEQNVNDGTPGTNSVRYAGAYSGLGAIANLPPGSNSTALHDLDPGAFIAGAVRETTAGQGSRPVGFVGLTDDLAAVHLAVRELAGTFVTPTVIAVTVTLPTPTLLAASVTTPAVLAVTATFPAATAKGQAQTAPTVIAATSTLPTPTILAGAKPTPTVIATTVALPTPAALAGSVVTPGVLATTVALPTPTAQGQARPLPAVIATTVSLPTPTIDIGGAPATVTPAVLAVTTTLPIPAVIVAAITAPSVIAALVILPTATLLVAATVNPAVIPITVSLPVPVGSSGPRAVRNPVAYTLNPSGYDPITGGDTPPWN